MSDMENEQLSALIDLLNFCRRATRTQQVDVEQWRRLRGRMNKAFQTPGPPRIKTDPGLISDLKRGVPVSVVAKKNGMSRGTVYRMIREHPELAKEWEEKKKKKQPDPVPASATAPVPDPAPVQPTQPPLPDALIQFLTSHRPRLATLTLPVGLQRMAVRVLLSQLGLGQPDEFDGLSDEELVARVTAYQGKTEGQPDEARRDAVELPPPPSPPMPSGSASGVARFQVTLRGVDELLTRDETAKLLVDEITQNLEPFADMNVDHPLFAELKLHVKVVVTDLMLSGRRSISDDDIPEIARKAVRRIKDRATFPSLPREVLEFAAITPSPVEPPCDGVEGKVGC